MDKEKNIAEEIKTKDDIKKFFRRMIEDKQALLIVSVRVVLCPI